MIQYSTLFRLREWWRTQRQQKSCLRMLLEAIFVARPSGHLIPTSVMVLTYALAAISGIVAIRISTYWSDGVNIAGLVFCFAQSIDMIRVKSLFSSFMGVGCIAFGFTVGVQLWPLFPTSWALVGILAMVPGIILVILHDRLIRVKH